MFLIKSLLKILRHTIPVSESRILSGAFVKLNFSGTNVASNSAWRVLNSKLINLEIGISDYNIVQISDTAKVRKKLLFKANSGKLTLLKGNLFK